jgi:hypothetical protein
MTTGPDNQFTIVIGGVDRRDRKPPTGSVKPYLIDYPLQPTRRIP